MASIEYRQKLKDPRWQKKRLMVFYRDNWMCTSCGRDDQELHVHHLRYGPGEPWDVPLDRLVTLCSDCHMSLHQTTAPNKGMRLLLDISRRRPLNSKEKEKLKEMMASSR